MIRFLLLSRRNTLSQKWKLNVGNQMMEYDVNDFWFLKMIFEGNIEQIVWNLSIIFFLKKLLKPQGSERMISGRGEAENLNDKIFYQFILYKQWIW